MNRFLLALAFTAVLAGCGSSVKLDDVAVEDKSGTPVAGQGGAGGQGGAAGAGGSAGGVTNTAIAPVNLGAAGGAGAAAMVPAEARTVYFDYDSFVIKPAYQAVIESQARYLKADRNRKASIEGHTDERGGREYNLALGQKRSEAVRRALGLLDAKSASVSQDRMARREIDRYRRH